MLKTSLELVSRLRIFLARIRKKINVVTCTLSRNNIFKAKSYPKKLHTEQGRKKQKQLLTQFMYGFSLSTNPLPETVFTLNKHLSISCCMKLSCILWFNAVGLNQNCVLYGCVCGCLCMSTCKRRCVCSDLSYLSVVGRPSERIANEGQPCKD